MFDKGLGLVKDVMVDFVVDSDVQPRFYKVKPVSYPRQAQVEAELDRLAALKIIEPVSLVLKKDGSIRICEDYKLTANLAVRWDKYPLPQIEHLFASLTGGTVFSNLD